MSSALLENLANVDAGGCPAPFIGESLYPYRGGFYGGRNCAPNPLVDASDTGNVSRCCIPCPVFDYVYDDHFHGQSDGAAWANVAGFILCGILLISYAALPAKVTRRSFLNIILLIGIMMLELGFIIPLGQQPEQCFDPVTPNGMRSSATCAAGGGFATFGGMALVSWVLVRALFMHLQICWSIVPDRTYYIAANVAVWSITIALTSAVLAHVGVSFRFGGYCHVNVGSISTYWAWLVAFAGISLLLQLATFAYCLQVYISAAFAGRQQLTAGSNKSGSMSGTTQSRNARITARRVWKVLALQWRSLAIVMIAIFTTALVCVVFMVYDDKLTQEAFVNTDALIPWILCIIEFQDNSRCLNLTGPIILPQKLAVVTLYFLGFVGIEAFLLLFRVAFMKSWLDLLRTPFWKKKAKRSTWTGERDATPHTTPRRGNAVRGEEIDGGDETSTEATNESSKEQV
ncbi:uncharacterized protein RCC_05424 [Ramularia collo-cygni]|uniref:G-protein coupled receptors family 2 profile 2 domain-containing protein n=1 Tax=Ramularia collo-cygni TaxID=112498 RepID=A0A2D3VG00_9PEZI|nr:uncharacterized protein RCC_05424 [Ramularia collo-cygni]CZT19573.1 uncharacterized protein RCC_05424 [Ramularia collo-cygni]